MAKKETLTVKPYCINRGTSSQYFGLAVVEGKEKTVMHSAPNNWKTENGAIRWAKKNGYKVKEPKPKKAPAKKATVKKAPARKVAPKKSAPKKATAKRRK